MTISDFCLVMNLGINSYIHRVIYIPNQVERSRYEPVHSLTPFPLQ
jgi:hypothetical protein